MKRKKTKNKNNKLFLKYRYLVAELKDAEEVFDEAKVLFIAAANKYIGNNSEGVIKDNSTLAKDIVLFDKKEKKKDDICPSKNDDIDHNMKSLYKKIAIVTHPDKHNDSYSDNEKKRLVGLYNRANNAVSEKNLFDLLDIASELHIDIPELTDKQVKTLEKTCVKVKEDINVLFKTYPWIWFHEDDENIKLKYLKEYLIRTDVIKK